MVIDNRMVEIVILNDAQVLTYGPPILFMVVGGYFTYRMVKYIKEKKKEEDSD